MNTKFSGRVWKFGDNISGDNGILDFEAVRDHAKPFDEQPLADMCFRKINPNFSKEAKKGDIVVGGTNFAKPAHDQVVVAIRDCGIQAILCESCEARFVRKGINIGLPIILCPGITKLVGQNQTLKVDLETGEIENLTTGAKIEADPYPQRMLDILHHGGVVEFLAHYFSRSATTKTVKDSTIQSDYRG